MSFARGLIIRYSKLKIMHRISRPGEVSFKVGCADAHRGGVDVRVEIDTARLLQVLIDDNDHFLIAVVDQAEWRYGAGFEPEVFLEPFGRSEAEPVLTQLLVQPAEVGLLGAQQDNQVMAVPFLVAKEEVFAVSSLDAGPMPFGLLDREHGRMLVPGVGNPQNVQDLQDLGFRRMKAHRSALTFLVSWMAAATTLATRLLRALIAPLSSGWARLVG